MSMSDHLRARMAQAGITQQDVAAVLGVQQSEVSRRLSGRTPWKLNDLHAIAGLFGVPTYVLMRDAEDAAVLSDETAGQIGA